MTEAHLSALFTGCALQLSGGGGPRPSERQRGTQSAPEALVAQQEIGEEIVL